MLDSGAFPWYYNLSGNFGAPAEAPAHLAGFEDCPQMTHEFIVRGESTSNHTAALYDLAGDLIAAVARDRQILRIKANLLQSRSEPVLTQPHYDRVTEATSAILYINDSDGDTVFFNKLAGDDLDGMAEVDRCTPTAGSAVIFDARQYHAGSLPVETKARVVLNILAA